ncbi:hypothetical protein TRVL_10407 [Trypanosoma vivax]|nr:hypothetical protein TRVL_10407 [Trypanosoma vivax]
MRCRNKAGPLDSVSALTLPRRCRSVWAMGGMWRNVHQWVKAPIVNDSRAPKIIKASRCSNAALLPKHPVQEGKRSLFNSNAIVGSQVYKALCVYKWRANKAQITITKPLQETGAQKRTPKLNTHNAAIKSAQAPQAQQVVQRGVPRATSAS